MLAVIVIKGENTLLVEEVEELTFNEFAPLLTVVVSLAIVQFTLDFPHTSATASPPVVVLSIVAVPSNPPFNPRKDLVCPHPISAIPKRERMRNVRCKKARKEKQLVPGTKREGDNDLHERMAKVVN
jgi:hypothetical protein